MTLALGDPSVRPADATDRLDFQAVDYRHATPSTQLESRCCTDICGASMRFEETKSDTLNLRVSPSFKLALKAAADNEQRSMVNMLEVLVANYCDQHRITVPAKQQRQHRAGNRSHVKAAA